MRLADAARRRGAATHGPRSSGCSARLQVDPDGRRPPGRAPRRAARARARGGGRPRRPRPAVAPARAALVDPGAGRRGVAECWRRAAAEAGLAGDERMLADALGWEASALTHGPTPVDEAFGRCNEILARACTANPWAEALVHHQVAALHAMRGEFDRGVRAARRGERGARRLLAHRRRGGVAPRGARLDARVGPGPGRAAPAGRPAPARGDGRAGGAGVDRGDCSGWRCSRRGAAPRPTGWPGARPGSRPTATSRRRRSGGACARSCSPSAAGCGDAERLAPRGRRAGRAAPTG